jgi:SAM-dependent methyltransferase
MTDSGALSASRLYYEKQYAAEKYSGVDMPSEHAEFRPLSAFIDQHRLRTASTLEIGSGKGLFQDLAEDYTGLDVADALKHYYRENKRYVVGSGNDLPFEDNSFSFVFSIHALEHIPEPERVLSEIRRTIRDGGLVYLAPAWQCRPWAADGYPVRPYSDFGLKGKLIKASIPLRNSVFWRMGHILPQRISHAVKWFIAKRPTNFRYQHIRPNYDVRWMSDSDAINSMDPYEAILWFVSRGDVCISYPTLFSAFCVRTGALVFRIHKK